MPTCPVCKDQTVIKQFTYRGILYAIFCFPCGLYCCLKTNRQLYCPVCGCQVIYSTGEMPLIANRYRFYSSTSTSSTRHHQKSNKQQPHQIDTSNNLTNNTTQNHDILSNPTASSAHQTTNL